MGCLYKIDFVSGKSYIGITRRTADARFAEHVSKAPKAANSLGRAIVKYGTHSCIG